MLARRLTRIALWTLAAFAVLILAAFLWLRQTPAWAGITLFWESHRVENFRAMDQVFPDRPVSRGADVWAFDRAPAPLPGTYAFDGATRHLDAFLDRTETTGLLVVHRGAITHEAYRQGADETSPFTSWSMAKSVLSALIGMVVVLFWAMNRHIRRCQPIRKCLVGQAVGESHMARAARAGGLLK